MEQDKANNEEFKKLTNKSDNQYNLHNILVEFILIIHSSISSFS